ncbi:hypothetical protein [Desulfovibrio psychrotolerans]|uniref:Uncharacterized protein n=1 Tax=Desulfovibrio psychrotolerans TaxID=415242 RepID=A0A7J0BWQ2_9BACT|nr:hypothetical protein [Desulfovibrio psychrotolerans]GFM37592.1 hypothetical protein DSM19430T_22760 [Desulfovibrio psychrotolerans]
MVHPFSRIRQHVMDKMFKPVLTTKSAGEGSGPGLTISLGIAGNMGGHLPVNSKAGKGITFSVLLTLWRVAYCARATDTCCVWQG